ELDLIPALGPVHRPLMEEPGMVRRFQAATAAAPVFEYLVLLADSPPFNDVRVRRAGSLAIDRTAMAADDGSSLARRIVAPVWPGGPASGPAPAVPPPDLSEAKGLLASAGWLDLNGDGTRERGGHRLQVVTMVSDAAEPTRERVIAAMRELGFFVDERVGSPAVLLNRMVAGRFDLGFMTWRGPADGDLTALLGTRGRHNLGRASDPEIDRLLEAIRA